MESKRFGLVKLIEQPCCNLLESGRETWITEHSVAHSKPLSCTQLWETITYCITLEDFPTHRLVSQEGNEWANKCGRLCHKSCLLNHICIGILLENMFLWLGAVQLTWMWTIGLLTKYCTIFSLDIMSSCSFHSLMPISSLPAETSCPQWLHVLQRYIQQCP